MKIGFIVQTNQKGQIVIPQSVRKELQIEKNSFLYLIVEGKGIHLYPIEDIITPAEAQDSYLKVLKLTRGGWQEEDWEKLRKKRKKIEISASKKRRKQ